MGTKKISDIRTDYLLASLHESDTHNDAIKQFEKWFEEANNSEIDDVNAMTLATVDANHKPHARIVLLKGVEENKFVFFTNYNSHKGKEIEENKFISLVFYWKELQRQIRIEGSIEKINDEASTTYFHSRPLESQIGAWASHQSELLVNREELETRFEAYKNKFTSQAPKPAHWGGYAVTPNLIEFWQGRASRLHDRIVYEMINNTWKKYRLNP